MHQTVYRKKAITVHKCSTYFGSKTFIDYQSFAEHPGSVLDNFGAFWSLNISKSLPTWKDQLLHQNMPTWHHMKVAALPSFSLSFPMISWAFRPVFGVKRYSCHVCFLVALWHPRWFATFCHQLMVWFLWLYQTGCFLGEKDCAVCVAVFGSSVWLNGMFLQLHNFSNTFNLIFPVSPHWPRFGNKLWCVMTTPTPTWTPTTTKPFGWPTVRVISGAWLRRLRGWVMADTEWSWCNTKIMKVDL